MTRLQLSSTGVNRASQQSSLSQTLGLVRLRDSAGPVTQPTVTHHPSIRPRRLRVSKSMVTARVHSASQALWKTLTEAERSGVRAREASCTGHGMVVSIPWVVMDGIVVWCGLPPRGQHCGCHSHGCLAAAGIDVVEELAAVLVVLRA